MFNNGIDKIVPTAFIMMSSGGYQTQHLRSWDLTGGMHQINSLANHIAQNASVVVSSDLINKAAHGIMSLGTDHQGAIQIADGWDSRRGVFILRFNVHYQIGNTFEWIIQGFTDSPAFTDRSIDENMVFYINNVFCMNRTTVQYNGITTQRMNLQADYQVVSGFGGGVVGQPGGNLLIRPRDVLSNIATADLMGSVRVTDATQLANFGVQTSRHVNNVPSMMLADTLNSWHQASTELDVTASVGQVAEMTYAKVLETEAEQDLFMNMLARHNNTGTTTSSFSGRQLMRTMDGIMRVYQPVSSQGARVQWSSANESMGNADINSPEKSIAVNIQAMLPSIMIESLLSGVSFSVTNYSGRMEFARQYVSAFVPEMDVQQWAIFQSRVEREIMPLFTKLGWSFMLQVSCNFYQEIKIYIKMQDEVQFVAPAFCSALYAPVQTSSALDAKQFATEFETMASEINEALMESEIRRASKENRIMGSVLPAQMNNAFQMPQPVMAPTPTPAINIPSAPPVGVIGGTSQGSMTAGLSGMRTASPGMGSTVPTPSPQPTGGSMTAGLRR